MPRVVEFAAELPREESGKIFKRKLREPYWRDSGRDEMYQQEAFSLEILHRRCV